LDKVYLNVSDGVPQFVCTACSNCHSIMGISMCDVQNRGCCSYFPKFELHDLHKMSKTAEGLNILDQIRAMPSIIIYKYYIHAKGYFNEMAYKSFVNSDKVSDYDIEDKTIFFRACPFVKPGMGCTLPVKFRHYICNVFICRDVTERAETTELFEEYKEACSIYARWLKRENGSLEMLLREENITLEENFNDVIEFLKDLPLEYYEFPQLPEITISSGFSIGA
jgi:hypothetical protein